MWNTISLTEGPEDGRASEFELMTLAECTSPDGVEHLWESFTVYEARQGNISNPGWTDFDYHPMLF